MFAKLKHRAVTYTYPENFHSLQVQGVSLACKRCVANWYPVAMSYSKEILALKPGSKKMSYLRPSRDMEQDKQSFSTLQINHNYKSS